MVTKDKLLAMGGCGDLHYTGLHDCSKIIGPRGGVRLNITTVRLSGRCQTWKRDAERFRQPVKYGLYKSSEVTERNAADFHHCNDCPLNQE